MEKTVQGYQDLDLKSKVLLAILESYSPLLI